jgi:hypothetical protein
MSKVTFSDRISIEKDDMRIGSAFDHSSQGISGHLSTECLQSHCTLDIINCSN